MSETQQGHEFGELHTVAKAAEILGCTYRHVYRLHERHLLELVKVPVGLAVWETRVTARSIQQLQEARASPPVLMKPSRKSRR